jgi:hypothetical protein
VWVCCGVQKRREHGGWGHNVPSPRRVVRCSFMWTREGGAWGQGQGRVEGCVGCVTPKNTLAPVPTLVCERGGRGWARARAYAHELCVVVWCARLPQGLACDIRVCKEVRERRGRAEGGARAGAWVGGGRWFVGGVGARLPSPRRAERRSGFVARRAAAVCLWGRAACVCGKSTDGEKGGGGGGLSQKEWKTCRPAGALEAWWCWWWCAVIA